MHDDRIAGVTFEEIALCNVLIVNEEYAWVGNPFSAPRGQGEPKGSPCPLVFCRRAGFVTRDLKTPLSGVGGVDKQSRNHSCAARVRVPFSAPKQQGGPQWFSLLLWVLSCGFVPGDLKTPLSGVGGVDKQSQNHSCAARVRVPFSAPEGPERNLDRKQKALYISDMQGFFLYSPTLVDAKGSKYFRS